MPEIPSDLTKFKDTVGTPHSLASSIDKANPSKSEVFKLIVGPSIK